MRFERSVVIERPVEDVWAFLTNLDNFRHVSISGSEFRQSSPGPLGVGTSVESHRLVLGRFDMRLQTLVVTDYVLNRTVGMTLRIGLAAQPGIHRWTVEPINEGTRLTRSAEMELKRGIRPFAGILTGVLGWGWPRELGRIKRLVEAGTYVGSHD
jgi:carbon monoxide dehydrogenase subunit G